MRFGGLAAVNNVSLSVPRGEIRAIIGPNGAGKSTFFNCLTGVLHPSGGRILLDGEDVAGLPPNRISRKGIARSYQITNILPGATVLENVRIAAQSRHHGWSLLSHHRAFGDLIARAQSVLEAVALREKASELAANPAPRTITLPVASELSRKPSFEATRIERFYHSDWIMIQRCFFTRLNWQLALN